MFDLRHGIRIELKTSWAIETRRVLSGTFGIEATKHQRVSLKTPLGMGGSTFFECREIINWRGKTVWIIIRAVKFCSRTNKLKIY